MSKELDEFYKSYSARIIAVDDTSSVEVMDGGKFKLLSIEEYEEMANKIADLETRLAKSEKERELDNSFWKQECDSLQKTLAEKDKEIEYQESMKILAVKNQNLTAIEQLEKAKSFCIYAEDNGWCVTHKNWLEIVEYIDNQIKAIKGE